jgi:hypothetical protein
MSEEEIEEMVSRVSQLIHERIKRKIDISFIWAQINFLFISGNRRICGCRY